MDDTASEIRRDAPGHSDHQKDLLTSRSCHDRLVRFFPIVAAAAIACACGTNASRQPDSIADATGPDAGTCTLTGVTAVQGCSAPGRCPSAPPANARALVQIATCSFDRSSNGCTPVPIAQCPAEQASASIPVVNPNNNAVDAGTCAGTVDVDVFSVNGMVEFGFGVQELDPNNCQPLGPHLDGKGRVAAPCCSSVVDVDFPTGGFTFRLEIRGDWQL